LKKQTICFVGAAFAGLSLLFAQAVPASADVASTATVNKSVNFRADANTNGKVYGRIPAGTVLPVESANNYWVLVDYNGKTGYVSRSYVTLQGNMDSPVPDPTPIPVPATAPDPVSNPTTSMDTGSNIVNIAKTYQGKVTYQFNKNDPAHLILDCSSFTKMVYTNAGVNLKWGSKAQATQGSAISKNNLQPGDLVFFSVNTPGAINHVGIYVGNGQFINNLPDQGVVITDMNSAYWTSHYISARRVQ